MSFKSLSKDSEKTEQDSDLKFGTQLVEYLIHVCTEAFYDKAKILVMGVSKKFQVTRIIVFLTTPYMIDIHLKASV